MTFPNKIYENWRSEKPIPVVDQSKASVYSRSRAGISGSNLAWGLGVCWECSMSSGRGVCDGSFPHPEESYLL